MTDLRHLIAKAIFIHIFQIFKVCPNLFLLHRQKKNQKIRRTQLFLLKLSEPRINVNRERKNENVSAHLTNFAHLFTAH